MGRKRIHVGRRAGRIGFLGKGMSVPSRQRPDIAHALALRVGEERISTEDSECERYRYDFAPRRMMLRRLFSKTPDVVAFPDSGQCAADILDICIEEKTPAVPRGGGSRGLGGAIPVRGGVVIDTSRLNRVLSIDKAAMTVTVEAGCTWKTLADELAEEGLCLCAYPSSARAATVGGWMSTGGCGVGTHREGNFRNQVLSMEVALASGLLVSSAPGDGRYGIRSFAGTEGQMGVITRLTFPVRTKPERRACYVIVLKRESDGFKILEQLASVKDPPFSARLVGHTRARLLLKETALAGGAGLVSVVEEGDEPRVKHCDTTVRRIARSAGLDIVDGADAWKAWEEATLYLDAVMDGRVHLTGEVLVDAARLESLAGIVDGGAPDKDRCLYECRLVDGGRVLLSVGAVGPEGGGGLPTRDVFLTGRVAALALKAGGLPYGIGLWNSPHSRRILGRDFRDLRTVKREIDRLGLVNPGKVFTFTAKSGFPVPRWAYRFAVSLAGADR